MATGSDFPTSLDSFTDKEDGIDDILAVETNTQSSAIEALEAKVGIDGSADATSHDYRIDALETNLDPSGVLDDYVLTVDSGLPAGYGWKSNPNGFADPTTTAGDIIYRNGANTLTRLPKGNYNQILGVGSATLEYKDILNLEAVADKKNYLISFAEASSTDGYPAYLSPGGASSLTTTLLAATTPFVFNVNGTETTISANKTVSITAGYSSNNTLLINESSWTGGSSQETQAKVFGEKAHPSVIMNYDNAGSNISGLSVGDKVVFRAVNSSAAVEYIYCEMVTVGASGTLRILWRAIDSSGVRITFRDNDTWTLCRTNWIFTDGTSLYATTVHPVEVDTLPSAGTAGKYILLKSTNTWYLDNGSTVAITARTLLGASFSHNATDNGAVAYFPEWGHFSYKFLNMKKSDVQVNVAIDNLSTSKGLMINGTVRIGDKIYKYKDTRVNTATAGDRIDSTNDISAVGIKYLYVSYSTGKLYLSDVMPRKWDEGVLMHPNKMYRCVWFAFHSGSAFYQFVQYENNKVMFTSVSTTFPASSYSLVPLLSGYVPSFLKSMEYTYISNSWNSGATDSLKMTNSYISTNDDQTFIGRYENAQAGAGYFGKIPCFSGYSRLKSTRGGTDINNSAFIQGYQL